MNAKAVCEVRMRNTNWLGCIGLTVMLLSTCGSSPTYTEPPQNSYETSSIKMSIAGSQKTVTEVKVGASFFKTAGVLPLLGRGFLPQEFDRPANVVILSDRQWNDSFGRNPSCIGTRILIDGAEMTIVGVMPQSFDFPSGVDIWIPRQ